ncbi:MAG: glycosyltransferase [Elusimicrobia bacterium]|nr:glycosyltransferase [Elusimicrobiota bacterium]
MPARPLVSLCIPTYNGLPYLRDCVESVLAQTFRDFELLVVDDASTDGTVAYLERRLRGDRRLRLHRNPRNLGLVRNWNRCVELSAGVWVKFVFQDDLLKPAGLERLLALGRRGGALAVCRRSARFEDGVPPEVRQVYRRHFRRHTLARRFPGRSSVTAREFAGLVLRHPGFNCVGEPTAVLVRRSAFESFGPFNASLAGLCDWEFWARVAVNCGLRCTDEDLAVFRVHPRGRSLSNRRERRYRAEVIDELIIRHELAYAPAFAPVRRAAALTRPRVDLVGSLAGAARWSRRLLGRRAWGGGAGGRDARRAWSDALESCPRLAGVLAEDGAAPSRDGRRYLDIARGLFASAGAGGRP